MKIALLGATGGTGVAFLEMALEAGHDVTCVARTPSKITTTHERLEVLEGDVRRPQTLTPAFAGRDAVVGIFGVAGLKAAMKPTDLYSVGTKNVLDAMTHAGCPRLLMISSSAVLYDPGAPAFWNKVLRPLCWRMYTDMSQMEILIAESDVEWTVIRPPELTDAPETGALEVAHDVIPPGAPKVSRADLARFTLEELETPRWTKKRPILMSRR